MIRQRRLSVVVAVIVTNFALADLRAERVGFTYAGTLEPELTTPMSLFGIANIPRPAPISGSFAYDSTNPGVVTSGSVSYPQSIEAGFTLNIAGTMVRLSANNFKIRVTNDFHRQMPIETVDVLDIAFDSFDALTPGPLTANDVPWTGNERNFIILELTYPPETFADASLPTILPPPFSTALYSTVSSSSAGVQRFTVDTLSPISKSVGDYNFDGKVDYCDLVEWRRGHGDGNEDGLVDACDYVIWRKVLANAGGGNAFQMLPLPEPAGVVTTILAASVSLLNLRYRTRSAPFRV